MENIPPRVVSFSPNLSPITVPCANSSSRNPLTPRNAGNCSTPCNSTGKRKEKRNSRQSRRSLGMSGFPCPFCAKDFVQRRGMERHKKKCPSASNVSLTELSTLSVSQASNDASAIQSSNDSVADVLASISKAEIEIASSKSQLLELEREAKSLKAKADNLERRKRHYELKFTKSQRQFHNKTKQIGRRNSKSYGNVSSTQARLRQAQLYQGALVLAGTSTEAAQLLWDTTVRKCSTSFLKQQMLKCRDLIQPIVKADKLKAASLVNSELNLLRTANVIFQHGSKMSYRKFRILRSKLRATNDIRLPGVPLATYEATLTFCRSKISHLLGELHPITDIFHQKLHDDQSGMFRDLEPLCIRKAEKLLRAAFQSTPTIELKWAGQEFTFHLVYGFDGFPWGSRELTTAEISFLEVGSRVHSPEMLSIVFAGTFGESSDAVLCYCKHFAALLAHMFSPYITVHKQDKQVLFGSIGTKGNWRPITYRQRTHWLAEAEQEVQKRQHKQKKAISKAGRGKLLCELNNPQKCDPPIGALSDHLVIDVLHIGINTLTKWLEGFVYGFVKPLTDLLISPGARCPNEPLKTIYPSHTYPQICETDEQEREKGQIGVPFVRLLEFLAKSMRMGRVAKQLRKGWNNGHQNLQFRLQGEDVRMLCHFSPQLVQMFLEMFAHVDLDQEYTQAWIGLRERLNFLHYTALLLRKIMTLASRTEVTPQMLDALESLCQSFQNVKVAVSRSSKYDFHHQIDHTIAYVLPYHARVFAETYPGKGIAHCSMQGHEKMHQDSKKILSTTHTSKMWVQLFEYSEIMSNFLPVELNKVGINYTAANSTYTPTTAQHIPVLSITCEIEGCLSCQENEDLNEAAKSGSISSDFGAR